MNHRYDVVHGEHLVVDVKSKTLIEEMLEEHILPSG